MVGTISVYTLEEFTFLTLKNGVNKMEQAAAMFVELTKQGNMKCNDNYPMNWDTREMIFFLLNTEYNLLN